MYGKIPPSMRNEIEWIKNQCVDHLSGKHKWTKLISQMIKRELDGNIAQDASTSWGMDGFSTLGFYWQYSWKDFIPDRIEEIKSKQLSINVLELVAIVVNFFATATYFNLHPTSGGWAPKVHCRGDNSLADSWYKQFTNANMIARTLAQLLARG